MDKPAHLPFNLLAWGQDYVQRRNCPPEDASVDDLISFREKRHFTTTEYLRNKSAEYYDLYGICNVNVHKHHHGAPYHVTFYDERLTAESGVNLTAVESLGDLVAESNSLDEQPSNADSISSLFLVNRSVTAPAIQEKSQVGLQGGVNTNVDMNMKLKGGSKREPVKFVYYSECDQVVRFDTLTTLRAVSAALNDTTFFTGRRKEKRPESPPEEYMGGLEIWRNCGAPGYSMIWPRSNKVQVDA